MIKYKILGRGGGGLTCSNVGFLKEMMHSSLKQKNEFARRSRNIGGDQSNSKPGVYYKSGNLTCITIIFLIFFPVDVVKATKER